MPALDSPETLWFVIGLLIVGCTLGCLRVIGFEYANAVAWHDLRVRVHELRIKHKQRLAAGQHVQSELGNREKPASSEFAKAKVVEENREPLPSLSIPTPAGAPSTEPRVPVEVIEMPVAAAAA